MTGNRDDAARLARWERRYAARPTPPVDPWLEALPAAWLREAGGPALDLACGAGQNSLWVARMGCRAVGVDGSLTAVEQARRGATHLGADAAFEVVQLSADPLPALLAPKLWGAVLVFHFLDRGLFGALQDTLAPGGLLIYKTFLNHPLRPPERHPRSPRFLLQPGELLTAFPALMPLAYREWTEHGGQAYAALLARRPRRVTPRTRRP